MTSNIPKPAEAPTKPSVLLDSNLWRYLVDAHAGGTLVRQARQSGTDILVAPAVVYEALRLRDIPTRNAIIRLMTNSAFRRLMPEAYIESMEFLREVERLRPKWLRSKPALQFFDRLRLDWKKSSGGFWVRCKNSPEREAGYLHAIEGPMIEGAQAQARNARREMIEVVKWNRNPPMDKTMAAFQSSVSGWRGDPFEAWRMDGLTVLTHALREYGNPYRDWIAPFIELDYGLLDSAEWVEFWVYLADQRGLSLQWIRWASSFAQRFRRVSPGTPGDSQLFTYFPQCTAVISADKILLEILEEIRPYAPCRLPNGHLVPANGAGVAALFECLIQEKEAAAVST